MLAYLERCEPSEKFTVPGGCVVAYRGCAVGHPCGAMRSRDRAMCFSSKVRDTVCLAMKMGRVCQPSSGPQAEA